MKPKAKPRTDREAAQVGPRQTKDPRSVEYAWQTLAWLTHCYKSREVSAKRFEGALHEATQNEIYKRVPPERPYGSLDAMLRAEIGVGESEAVSSKIAEAARATTGEVLPARGDHRSEQSECKLHPEQKAAARAAQAGVSVRTQRKLDALARKAPGQLGRVRAGEVSVHRACVEAGLVKEPTALDLLRRSWKNATPRQREAFLAEVSPCPTTAPATA